MVILPLHPEIKKIIEKKGLVKKFEKQVTLFCSDPFYPGLNTEILEPKQMRIWSFRIDKKFRAIFIFRKPNEIEILDVNNHYQ